MDCSNYCGWTNAPTSLLVLALEEPGQLAHDIGVRIFVSLVCVLRLQIPPLATVHLWVPVKRRRQAWVPSAPIAPSSPPASTSSRQPRCSRLMQASRQYAPERRHRQDDSGQNAAPKPLGLRLVDRPSIVRISLPVLPLLVLAHLHVAGHLLEGGQLSACGGGACGERGSQHSRLSASPPRRSSCQSGGRTEPPNKAGGNAVRTALDMETSVGANRNRRAVARLCTCLLSAKLGIPLVIRAGAEVVEPTSAHSDDRTVATPSGPCCRHRVAKRSLQW